MIFQSETKWLTSIQLENGEIPMNYAYPLYNANTARVNLTAYWRNTHKST